VSSDNAIGVVVSAVLLFYLLLALLFSERF